MQLIVGQVRSGIMAESTTLSITLFAQTNEYDNQLQ